MNRRVQQVLLHQPLLHVHVSEGPSTYVFDVRARLPGCGVPLPTRFTFYFSRTGVFIEPCILRSEPGLSDMASRDDCSAPLVFGAESWSAAAGPAIDTESDFRLIAD